MKFVYAFLIILACFLPIFIGGGFGLDALIKYCGSNSSCAGSLMCKDHRCVDPCIDTTCGSNAKCYAGNHNAHCKCLPHFKGDPLKSCEQKCDSDKDCGVHAKCQKSKNSPSQCKCQRKYKGNPWDGCYKSCSTNKQCGNEEICWKKKCSDPCVNSHCGINAHCESKKRVINCICNNCYTGDPTTQCNKKRTAVCNRYFRANPQ